MTLLEAAPRRRAARYEPVDLEPLLPLVEKPQRYAGGERQAYHKALGDCAVSWALCFPEAYEIGMSHLGLKILYHILNEVAWIGADRAYCPWVDMEALLRERQLPAFAHESRAALGDFDVLGFSLQYELTYGNILTMLDLAGVPLRAADRNDNQPLVVGGGPCMTNPEPVADFFDAFLIGDGEEAVLEVSEAVRTTLGAPRRQRLAALAAVRGVYVPGFYAVDYDGPKIRGFRRLDDSAPERVERVWVEDLSQVPYPTNPVVPIAEIVQDRYAVEVVRGCTQSCRFCQAGYWYRPVRERPVEQIVDLAGQGVEAGGFDDVSLISLSTADHSQVEAMTRGVAARVKDDCVSLSLPSLRADSFSVGIAEAAGEVKKNGFTFAPETGSERLRRVINKNITDESLLDAVGTAYRRGWNLVKLYFMIGIPTETLDDVESIAALTLKVNAVARQVGGGKRVTASVGTHVPKAFTPFQWEGFEPLDSLDEKLRHLRRRLPKNRHVRLKWHDPQPSYLEAVFSLGDRRAGHILEAAWRRGARFDGWHERFDMEPYRAAFAEAGVDPDWFTSGRQLDDILPWELIDASLTKKFLERERRKAVEERLTNDCRWGDCHMCGIPGAPDDIKLSVDLPEAPGVAGKIGLDGNLVRKAGFARRIKIEAAPPAAAPGEGPPVAARPQRPVASQSPAPPLVRRDHNNAAVTTYRVWFSVDGACRYVPHGDVVRAFRRALRVARLPVRYSEGFTPRPKLSFGPPLPVGLAGRREVLDVQLREEVDEIAERLNRALPEGLRVVDVGRAPAAGQALTATIGAATYEATIPAVWMEAVTRQLATFEEAGTWPYIKRRPGKPDRQIDLKRAILSLDPAPGGVRFRLAVRDPQGHETRAQTVLEAVLGLTPANAARVRVERLALYADDGTLV